MNIIPDTPQAHSEQVRQERIAKQQKEYHLVGKQRRCPGHTLFEFDRQTKEIRPAVIVRKAVMIMNGDVKYETRVEVKTNCFYIPALNVKDAAKKLRKVGIL